MGRFSEDGKTNVSNYYWTNRGKLAAKDGGQYNNNACTINTHSTVDDDELIFEEEDTTANTHEVIAETTESKVKVHSLKDATVRKKKKN